MLYLCISLLLFNNFIRQLRTCLNWTLLTEILLDHSGIIFCHISQFFPLKKSLHFSNDFVTSLFSASTLVSPLKNITFLGFQGIAVKSIQFHLCNFNKWNFIHLIFALSPTWKWYVRGGWELRHFKEQNSWMPSFILEVRWRRHWIYLRQLLCVLDVSHEEQMLQQCRL